MDAIDILFVVLLIVLLVKKKKTSLVIWGTFLLLGYVIIKYLKPIEKLTQPSRLSQIQGDIYYLKSIGLTETSNNETMKRLVAERNELEKSVAPPPVASPLRDTPVTPPAPLLPPVPAMKCSIENFGCI